MAEFSTVDNSVTLVLVVRNEEAGIREIVPRIPSGLFDDCFAIDGHSNDRTLECLANFGVRGYTQEEPGLGAAMLEARAYVKTRAFVYFHPDGNEDPEDLPKMVELLRRGAEFVVASRMIPGGWNEEDHLILKWRKWANQGLAVLANLFFASKGNRTTDVTNGFRGVTCEAFDAMGLTSKDLTMDYQMVIRALKRGIRIVEFPTREGLRLAGATSFASLPTGLKELKLLWREVFTG